MHEPSKIQTKVPWVCRVKNFSTGFQYKGGPAQYIWYIAYTDIFMSLSGYLIQVGCVTTGVCSSVETMQSETNAHTHNIVKTSPTPRPGATLFDHLQAND